MFGTPLDTFDALVVRQVGEGEKFEKGVDKMCGQTYGALDVEKCRILIIIWIQMFFRYGLRGW